LDTGSSAFADDDSGGYGASFSNSQRTIGIVIASVAKQSIGRHKEGMDCFVAFAPRNDGKHSFAISPQVCARFDLEFPAI
jgi:hypothetical protein